MNELNANLFPFLFIFPVASSLVLALNNLCLTMKILLNPLPQQQRLKIIIVIMTCMTITIIFKILDEMMNSRITILCIFFISLFTVVIPGKTYSE